MRIISILCLLLSCSMIWSQMPPVISGSNNEVQNLKTLTAVELISIDPVALKNTLQGNSNGNNCLVKPLYGHKSVNLQNGLTGKVAGLNITTTSQGVFKNERYTLRCIRTFSSDTTPLLIVDGRVIKLDTLSKINPIDISSVEILKSAASTALYGPDGVNGAIFITTKKSLIRTFIIKDMLDGSRIEGATILFTPIKARNERFQLMANESGEVVTDKLKRSENYIITVSAVGHKTLEQWVENNFSYNKNEILLEREFKTCDEVVLSTIVCPGRIIRCGWSCGVRGIRITTDSLKKEKEYLMPLSSRIFPNPIQKGGILNFQIGNYGLQEKIVQVVSLNGMILLQQTFKPIDGKNTFRLQTDSRWSAGVYFIRLLYENGQVAASQKVVIQ